MHCLRGLVLLVMLAAHAMCGEWHAVPEGELPDVLRLVQSSLETHWQATSRGWSRGTIYNTYQPESPKGSSGPYQIQASWDEKEKSVCVLIYYPESPTEMPLKFPSMMDAFYLRTPAEDWKYSAASRMLFGSKSPMQSRISSDWEIRPHEQWLSVSMTPMSQLAVIERMKFLGIHASRHDDGRVQLYSRYLRTEYDPQFGFGIVLLENGLNPDDYTESDRKTARPKRYRYEPAQDAHGVWYCKNIWLTQWPEGEWGNAKERLYVSIEEYDSAPPREKMCLDYQSLPVPDDTQVFSRIPKKSGQWVFGKKEAGKAELYGARIRNLAEKMRKRGFSNAERTTAPTRERGND